LGGEPPTTFRFERKEHLKGRKEIREVFGNGKRYGCQGAKLFVLKNDQPYNRICFSLSKGYGNAVSRNRAKRLGREAYRLMKNRLLGGHDLILLFYPKTEDRQKGGVFTASQFTASKLAYSKLAYNQIEFLFKKAGLFK